MGNAEISREIFLHSKQSTLKNNNFMIPFKVRVYNFFYKNSIGRFFINLWFGLKFSSSTKYWENRYKNDGNSGDGSYGQQADYKASFLNTFFKDNKVNTVIEFGCGDGNQLKQLKIPHYIGIDVSPTIIGSCKNIFKADDSKVFFLNNKQQIKNNESVHPCDVSLSLDVIYHLIEDEIFELYMHDLFKYSTKFVIIYAWDMDMEKSFHVKHRNFSKWVKNNVNDFTLKETITNSSISGVCDFFVYQKA
jgi:cyclopropane fatty-acyl-phospholipid synthase-like methyltransferase